MPLATEVADQPGVPEIALWRGVIVQALADATSLKPALVRDAFDLPSRPHSQRCRDDDDPKEDQVSLRPSHVPPHLTCLPQSRPTAYRPGRSSHFRLAGIVGGCYLCEGVEAVGRQVEQPAARLFVDVASDVNR